MISFREAVAVSFLALGIIRFRFVSGENGFPGGLQLSDRVIWKWFPSLGEGDK